MEACVEYIADNKQKLIRCLNYIAAILLLLINCAASAQDKKAGKHNVVMVVGKPLTSLDSIMIKQLFFSALREKTIENFTLASDFFNRVIQIDPTNDAAMFELATIRKLQNNYQDALQLLERAVTVKPDNEWYWVALADSYEKSNEISKLENVFNELIRLNGDKPDYYFDKANVYFLEKRYDDALAVYDQLEQMTGISDEIIANREKIYLKQGKVELAASELGKMIIANPQQIRYYLLLGELYNSNGLADKALKVLQTAEKVNPGNGLVHLALADIYRDKKNHEECYNQLSLAFAIPDLDIDQKIKIILGYLPKFSDPNAKASALELSRLLITAHPDDAKAYAIYADMLAQNAKYPEAKGYYKKSIELNEKVYSVREQLVRLELGENDIDGAIKDGEGGLAYFPNQAWLNYLVGVAWFQKKNYAKALSYINNTTALEVQDKELLSLSYSSLGDCYHALNDFQKSDSAYDKSLSYNPDNAYTLNNYAYYLSIRDVQLDKAAQMSKLSNELQPDMASFEDTYAWILFKQKKFSEAKTWIEKALLHDKSLSAVQTEHYGDIMFYLGNTDAAVQHWKKAKQYGGQSPVLERKINERKYIE